jgi:hypothetical protein
MADHWNNASFVVPLSAEQQVWAMTDLKRRESYEGDDDENPHNMHPSGGVCDLDIEPLRDGSGLVVVGDVSIEPLCDWLVSIMRQFSIAGAWTFEASYDCTKPRVDAFGGCLHNHERQH